MKIRKLEVAEGRGSFMDTDPQPERRGGAKKQK